MKILAAARHPGASESLGWVVSSLRDLGHQVLLLSLRNDTPETRIHGGSDRIFDRMGLEHVELVRNGYDGDVVNVPGQYADALIESFDPDRIVVGCSVDRTGEHRCIETVLLAAGQKRSIKTVQIAEMWDVWFPRKTPVYADAYTTIDEFAKSIMVARGAPSDRITVTGNPSLDAYAEPTDEERRELRNKLGLTTERLLIYFGQAKSADGSPHDDIALNWVIDAMQPRDRLIFTRHPRDVLDYEYILARAGSRLIRTTLSSDQLLPAADVCLTNHSTMGTKSALINISTINILLENDLTDMRAICGGFPASLVGGTYEANSADDVRDLLAANLVGNSAKLRKALKVDGGAAARIAQVVLS